MRNKSIAEIQINGRKKYNNLGEIKKVVTSQKEARTSTTNSQLPMSSPETTASDDPLSFRSPNGEVEDSPLSDSTSFHPLQTLTPTAINDALQTPFGIGTTNGVVDLDDPLLAAQTSIPKLSLPYSFIDPPSYEDVVFSPTQIDCNDRHSSSSLFHQIVVSDPQKEDGISYFTYLIKSKVATDGNEIMVRRRFRDVVLLADRLSEAYRGYFVPSRPDKSVVDSQVMQTHDFVEQRRVAIEKYLKRLAEHPVIGKSDEFKLFMETRSSFSLAVSNELEGVGRLPVLEQHLFGEDSGMGSSEESGQSARGGRDLMKLFRELKQSVVNDWGRVKPAVVEDDNELLVWKEKVQEFEQPLSNASQQVCQESRLIN